MKAQNLKRNDRVKMFFDSAMAKGNEVVLKVKSKRLVRKGKPNEKIKITLQNEQRPNSVNYFIYISKDGYVGYAKGDLAITVKRFGLLPKS